jgi:uncharacterized protein (DUF4415 family)
MNSVLTQTDWQRLESLSDDAIDTSDIPELDESFFAQAQFRQIDQKTVKLQLDSDVIDWFVEQGQGYQAKINHLLRSYMQTQQHQLQNKNL